MGLFNVGLRIFRDTPARKQRLERVRGCLRDGAVRLNHTLRFFFFFPPFLLLFMSYFSGFPTRMYVVVRVPLCFFSFFGRVFYMVEFRSVRARINMITRAPSEMWLPPILSWFCAMWGGGWTGGLGRGAP